MTGPPPAAALVRRPLADPSSAERTHQEHVPVDAARVRDQHDGYVAALVACGLDVVVAPPLPAHPDAVFVEDAAVVVEGTAVLTRPGAASRRGEVASLREPLRTHGLDVVQLPGAGTLDGGDVLQLEDGLVLVGRSGRTDDAGRAALAELLAPLGRRVRAVDVTGALHLKTAVTALPDGALVALPGAVALGPLGREVLAAPEPQGANVLVLGATVLLSASAPRTAELLADRGLDVVTVPLDELERMEAGPTCCSVLLP